MKKLIVALLICFATSAMAQVNFRVSPITLGAGGSSLTVNIPTISFDQPQPQQVIVLTPAQVPYYDQNLHGYCAAYRDHLYAKCIENARRQEFESAYRNSNRR